jgi:diadenosine tetraphosphate (Ap4A) HIT family hydrolase
MVFVIDPRLVADTLPAASLKVCELLIMNDRRYPWAILVPRIDGARELYELSESHLAGVFLETMAVSAAIGGLPCVSKVNVGALGNIVSQLHIHVVGRHCDDPAWPGPVWGHSARVDYEAGEAGAFIAGLMARLTP